MPKNQPERIIDARRSTGASVIVYSATSGGGTGGTTDHGALTGLADDDHTQYHNDARGDARYVPLARTVTAGAGLTGGGALSGDITLTVGAGQGITVNADDVALASSVAGSGLTYSSGVLNVGVANTINASGAGSGLSVEADTVRLTASSNPGAASSILACDASGITTLVQLTATTKVRTPLIDTASGDLTLSPAVKVALTTHIQANNYASQLTGWRVTYDGQADFRYLYVDEMHAKSFIADLEQALAGGQIIGKSVAMVAQNFTAPAAGATAILYVRDLPSAPNMAAFQTGDVVRLRTFSRSGGSLTIADCWGVVSDYTDGNGTNFSDGNQSYTFTRSSAPNAGTMSTGATVPADSLALDYGTAGNGYYEVNAIDGAYAANSPYSQIVTWSGHPATGQTVRARFGNLYGITGVSGQYGSFMGDVANANVLIEGTNGVQLRQGTTPVITLDTSGNSYFSGVMTIGTAGEIRQGTGTLGSNYTGLRIWRDSSVGLIGGYNSNTLQWYAGTDGKLYAGAGKVTLSSTGLNLTLDTGGSITGATAVKWSDGSHSAGMWANAASPTNKLFMELGTLANQAGAYDTDLTIGATPGPGGTGRILLVATGVYANGHALWTAGNLTSPVEAGGKSGGQTVYGGTAANEDLTLYGTSNATRTTSYINLQPSGGNVGIGITAPALPLHVNGTYSNPATTGTTPNGIAAFSVTNTFATLYIGNASSSPYAMWLQSQGSNALGTNYALALNPNGGNVGIGTINPGYTLEVSGTVFFTGDFSTGGGIGGSWSTMTEQGTNATVSGRAAQSRRFGDITFLRGAINPADSTGNLDLVQIATTGHRPVRDQYMIAASDTGTWVRIKVRASDGIILSETNTTGMGWISFDGLYFYNA